MNKTEAHVLLHNQESFIKPYDSILQGVTGSLLKFKIDDHCRTALQLKTNTITEFQIETEIWVQLSKAIFLLRNSDPKAVLKESCDEPSNNPMDYNWGLTESDLKVQGTLD